MVHSDGIWKCREHFENNDCKWCILTAFETTWKCRETFENKGGKQYILTVFGNAENILKTTTVNGAF